MVTPALTIRPYDSADFETLYAIDQSCYPRGIAYSRRELRWYLGVRGASCLVAQLAAKPDVPQRGSNEREIAAYGGSDQTRAARSAEIAGFVIAQASGSEAHLITLDVVAAHRRLGIGSALLRHMEQQLAAKGVRRITLETATSNEAGVAFWHRHGYCDLGIVRGYYLGRLDAYEMYKIVRVSDTAG